MSIVQGAVERNSNVMEPKDVATYLWPLFVQHL